MDLTPVKITTIRTDTALPFALWDKEGRPPAHTSWKGHEVDLL